MSKPIFWENKVLSSAEKNKNLSSTDFAHLLSGMGQLLLEQNKYRYTDM